MAASDPFAMTKLVISFNRHFFYIALAADGLGLLMIAFIHVFWLQVIIGSGVVAALYFVCVSVFASYVVYDRSDLYKLHEWPLKCFSAAPDVALIVHAGFDPSSGAFRKKYPGTKVRILDFFAPEETTEASINLAHKLNPPTGPQEHISFDAWPAEAGSQDAVLALSAAHEIRDNDKRVQFFSEARRVLRPGGKVIVIEQLRDLPNFLCFGFAAFHFLSYGTWLRSFKGAGLTIEKEFKISPFMHAFVLLRSG